MATSDRATQRAERLADEALAAIGRELRRTRIGNGVSQRGLAQAVGVSHTEISRIERGRAASVSYRSIVRLATGVGLALPARLYPAGDAIRDVGQRRLLDRFRPRLHSTLRWRTEVPLPTIGDLGSWDAVTGTRHWCIGVEAETVLDDIQALERRLALKRRDGAVDHVILLVADTPRNRRALAASASAFTDLPLRSRELLRALGRGADPGGSGIILL